MSRRRKNQGLAINPNEIQLEFRTWDGSTTISNVKEYVRNFLIENQGGRVAIGCDSSSKDENIKYGLAIAMRRPVNRGDHLIQASILLNKESMGIKRFPRKQANSSNGQFKSAILQRLWKEIDLIMLVMNELGITEDTEDDVIKRNCVEVHIDFNKKAECGSNALYAAGLGMFQGLGVKAVGKPDSPVASFAADIIANRG